jgi:hypothetical protein
MCRSIKVLRSPTPVGRDEIAAAALQFVRKVSGFHKPSKTNTAAFDQAVRDITGITERLLQNLAQPVRVSAPARRTAAGPAPSNSAQ